MRAEYWSVQSNVKTISPVFRVSDITNFTFVKKATKIKISFIAICAYHSNREQFITAVVFSVGFFTSLRFEPIGQ